MFNRQSKASVTNQGENTENTVSLPAPKKRKTTDDNNVEQLTTKTIFNTDEYADASYYYFDSLMPLEANVVPFKIGWDILAHENRRVISQKELCLLKFYFLDGSELLKSDIPCLHFKDDILFCRNKKVRFFDHSITDEEKLYILKFDGKPLFWRERNVSVKDYLSAEFYFISDLQPVPKKITPLCMKDRYYVGGERVMTRKAFLHSRNILVRSDDHTKLGFGEKHEVHIVNYRLCLGSVVLKKYSGSRFDLYLQDYDKKQAMLKSNPALPAMPEAVVMSFFDADFKAPTNVPVQERKPAGVVAPDTALYLEALMWRHNKHFKTKIQAEIFIPEINGPASEPQPASPMVNSLISKVQQPKFFQDIFSPTSYSIDDEPAFPLHEDDKMLVDSGSTAQQAFFFVDEAVVDDDNILFPYKMPTR